MIINCPECNKEVSDQAKNCIHCGFPLADYVDEKRRVSQFKKISLDKACPLCKHEDWTINEEGGFYRCGHCTYHHSFDDEKYDTYLDKQKELNMPKCPTCGSTRIKKISDFERFTLNYNQKVFRCNNCDYEW